MDSLDPRVKIVFFLAIGKVSLSLICCVGANLIGHSRRVQCLLELTRTLKPFSTWNIAQ